MLNCQKDCQKDGPMGFLLAGPVDHVVHFVHTGSHQSSNGQTPPGVHHSPLPCHLVPQVGNKAVLTGTIKVNGVATSTKVLQKVMGFVPQDDIVHEDLTVRWAGGGGTVRRVGCGCCSSPALGC